MNLLARAQAVAGSHPGPSSPRNPSPQKKVAEFETVDILLTVKRRGRYRVACKIHPAQAAWGGTRNHRPL